MIRALLELGRIPNIPTVWTNCLAAWILARGPLGTELTPLLVGATLVYFGGATLNDAFDIEFDRKHRGERPIPSGRMEALWVWVTGGVALAGGAACLVFWGEADWALTASLVLAILAYDAVHKKTALGVWLMGLCRALLYVVAASAVPGLAPGGFAIAAGVATGLYIVGLSYAARGERKPAAETKPFSRWPALLLSVPAFTVAAWLIPHRSLIPCLFVLAFAVWTLIALSVLEGKGKKRIPQGVSRLLAGIVLIDACYIAILEPPLALALLPVFGVVLLMQKYVPAT